VSDAPCGHRPSDRLGGAYGPGTLLKQASPTWKTRLRRSSKCPGESRPKRCCRLAIRRKATAPARCPRRGQLGELARLLKRQLAEVEVFLQSSRSERRIKEITSRLLQFLQQPARQQHQRIFFRWAATPFHSLMRLVMARRAALVAAIHLSSFSPASAISISCAQGPWLSPSSSIWRSR
jgi:hypothetical protein